MNLSEAMMFRLSLTVYKVQFSRSFLGHKTKTRSLWIKGVWGKGCCDKDCNAILDDIHLFIAIGVLNAG